MHSACSPSLSDMGRSVVFDCFRGLQALQVEANDLLGYIDDPHHLSRAATCYS